MKSYKRAIHTGRDYHKVWVLMGHTIPDTERNLVHLPPLQPGLGKVVEGRERHAAFFNQTGAPAGCVRQLVTAKQRDGQRRN